MVDLSLQNNKSNQTIFSLQNDLIRNYERFKNTFDKNNFKRYLKRSLTIPSKQFLLFK